MMDMLALGILAIDGKGSHLITKQGDPLYKLQGDDYQLKVSQVLLF